MKVSFSNFSPKTFFSGFRLEVLCKRSTLFYPSGVVEDVPEALVEDGQKNEKKKKRRKKRKIEEVVDSNEMSSEDKVKEEINDILGLVQKEEISEWIDSASIRLGNC